MKRKRTPPAAGARATSSARGYGSRWQTARLTFLREHPLCALCAKLGRTTAATVVDHEKPHRGDQVKFWDKANWQPLCKSCHDTHKQRLEKSGVLNGCDVSGLPLDANHHWNRARE